MPKRFRETVIFVSLFILPVSTVRAWDDDITHRDLSEVAAQRSVLGRAYLQDALKIKAGIRTDLRWDGGEKKKEKTILEWIQEGGEFEDASGRFFNHFHNPLRTHPWSGAGMDDAVLGISFTGGSALLWAQNAGIFKALGQTPNSDWSWQATRDYFYQALTFPGKADRDASLAQTFRGLGHQVHLIQDMSQPSHVRNDAHPEDPFGVIPFTKIRWIERLENWASINNREASLFMHEPSIFPEISFDSSQETFIPIFKFWDTDQYDGTAGTLPLTNKTTVGLAEYTNAHFFSDDTINSSRPRHQFKFPSVNITDYSICADDAPPGSFADRRWYISRKACSVDSVDHFLASSLLPSPKPTEISPSTQLDDRVYEDYARQLLPRAVGYSAGLIDYFFRGQLDVNPAQGGITIRNDSDEILGLDPVTNEIKGILSIYYDDRTSTRQELATLDLATLAAPSPLQPGQTTKLIPFLHPKDNLVARRYIIVYRGPLGAEQDAVIGKVTAPLQVFYRGDEAGSEKIYRVGIDGSDKTLVFDNPDETRAIEAMEVSPDMTRLAFTYGKSITIVDLETGQETTSILGPLTTPTWSPDGSEIVYDKGFGCPLPCIPPVEIIKRDLALGFDTQVTSQVEAGFDRRSPVNTQPAWSPDGNRIAYSMQLHEGVIDTKRPDCINGYVIALINPFGQPEGRLSCSASIAHNDREPAWSPDNKEVVFSRQQLGLRPGQTLAQLYKVSVLGGSPAKLTESAGPGFLERDPAWSPEGGLIALGSTRDGDFDIWLVDAGSGEYLLNLTDGNVDVNGNPAIDGNPAFGWMP